MAVATSIVRPQFNRGLYSSINLRLLSTSGVALGTVLTIAGDLVVTVQQFLPNGFFQCKVTALPRGKNRLIIRIGDTVTG